MRGKILFTSILSILILLSLVVAVTEIKVKTISGNDVTINILNPANDQTIEEGYFTETADENGIAPFSADTNLNSIDIIVIVRKLGKIIKRETFEGRSTGGIINLDLTDKKIEPVIEEPELVVEEPTPEEAEVEIPTEEVIIEDEPEVVNKGLTGNVIDDTKIDFKFPTYFYFIGLGLFVVGIVAFILKKTLSKGASKEFKVKPKEVKLDPEEEERELEDAEQKIKDAEEEISRIRNNKGKIRDAEKKYLESKEEYEKLKKGE